MLPALFNLDPVAVTGAAVFGQTDAYVADTRAGFVSVVLSGPDDYRLAVLDAADNVLAKSDRSGIGVEEALQVVVDGVTGIEVTVLACAASPGDVNADCAIGIVDFLALLAAWGPNPGHPADIDGSGSVDIADFLALLAAWGPVSNEYLLEVLARS